MGEQNWVLMLGLAIHSPGENHTYGTVQGHIAVEPDTLLDRSPDWNENQRR